MNPEFLTVCDHIAAAVLNGIWQGLALTVLVTVSLRVLGRSNAATRHGLWFCTLILVACLIPAQALRRPSIAGSVGTGIVESRGADATMGAEHFEAANLAWLQSGKRSPGAPDEVLNSSSPLDVAPDLLMPWGDSVPVATWPMAPESGDTFNALAAMGTLPLEGPPLAEMPGPGALEEGRGPKTRHWASLTLAAKVPRFTSLIFLATWLAVAAARSWLLLRQLRRISRLKRESLAPDAALAGLFHQLRSELGVRRIVDLRVSPAHRSPMVLGFVNPMVLLPVLEGEANAEPVLRHELAHVGRRDDWANLVQHWIQAALFIHPAVWWIGKQLALEREIACDDHVLHYNPRPKAYALLLANLASRLHGRSPVLAPGASTNKSQLQQRITMILDTQRNRSPRLAKARLGIVTSAAALVAMAGLYSAPRVVLAQDATPPAPPSVDAPKPETAPRPPTPGKNTPSDSAAPEGIGPSPRFKDAESPAKVGQPKPPARPLTPALVGPAGPLAPAELAQVPVPPQPVQPAQPYALRRAARSHNADATLEERIARLEEMVELLMSQQKNKPGPYKLQKSYPDDPTKVPSDATLQDFARQKEEIARHAKEMAKAQADMAGQQAEMARIAREHAEPQDVERAERDASRARDQAKRAAREAERAESADRKPPPDADSSDDVLRKLESLRSQQESLRRELEKVNRELERLQNKLKSQHSSARQKPQAAIDGGSLPVLIRLECLPDGSGVQPLTALVGPVVAITPTSIEPAVEVHLDSTSEARTPIPVSPPAAR